MDISEEPQATTISFPQITFDRLSSLTAGAVSGGSQIAVEYLRPRPLLLRGNPGVDPQGKSLISARGV